MSKGKVLAIQGDLSVDEKGAVLDVNIPINIINNSSVDFREAEVSVKDDQTRIVRTAYFGHINAHSRDSRTVSMPGGVEWCGYRIKPVSGNDVVGFGLADNAPGVDITISDGR